MNNERHPIEKMLVCPDDGGSVSSNAILALDACLELLRRDPNMTQAEEIEFFTRVDGLTKTNPVDLLKQGKFEEAIAAADRYFWT
jgi:hypothetical protein